MSSGAARLDIYVFLVSARVFDCAFTYEISFQREKRKTRKLVNLYFKRSVQLCLAMHFKSVFHTFFQIDFVE